MAELAELDRSVHVSVELGKAAVIGFGRVFSKPPSASGRSFWRVNLSAPGHCSVMCRAILSRGVSRQRAIDYTDADASVLLGVA